MVAPTGAGPAPRDADRAERGSGPPPGPALDAQPGVSTRTRVFRGPGGLPPRLTLAVTDLADRAHDLPWLADRQSFGTSWDDPARAVLAARAEAVERVAGAAPPAPGRLRHGSYQSLTGVGLRCVDPRELALYSDRQYATEGFPFEPFGIDSPAHWVVGHAPDTGETVLVPAFLVYAGWRRMPRPHPEPRYAFPAIGGIAAGTTYPDAVESGLREVVERDAAACWWAQAAALPALPVPGALRARLAGARRGFEVRLLALPTEFGMPVLAAGVRDGTEGWLTYGTAAHPDPYTAAAKALAEAYTLQLSCQTLSDPRTVVPTPGRRSPLKPWRADRRYLDSYRADHGDVVEQICHLQAHLDPRAADRVARWAWDLPAGSWSDLPTTPPDGRLLDRVRASGHPVVSVDLTTPEAAAAGLRVVRLVVPGTVGAAPAAYPYLGGDRLRRAGTRLGYRDADLAEDDLTTFPVPHS
ncbi:YcaO-like family protein [Micromonospora sp. WMMD980]|uniref:YcaO-like family protein n=1 Tax=Micromonospora sp. WMMD980 TaxID=3016088 RepID=UPI002417B25B|nr:YcaO-like family protein [Micromonospora sp. WMMD980]MDG4800210.1 YcaO-like family protein [Micromonospora sp. WMMD980]